jgi:iron complex outermembrane receptor protein
MKISKINTPPSLAGLESIFLSEREKAFILASAPKTKFNLNLNYKINKLTTNLQLVRFDKIRLIGYGGDTDYQDYGAKVTTDLSFGYEFSNKFSWVLGGKNILIDILHFSTHISDGNTESGGIFDPVQMGFSGRQVYTMITYNF